MKSMIVPSCIVWSVSLCLFHMLPRPLGSLLTPMPCLQDQDSGGQGLSCDEDSPLASAGKRQGYDDSYREKNRCVASLPSLTGGISDLYFDRFHGEGTSLALLLFPTR